MASLDAAKLAAVTADPLSGTDAIAIANAGVAVSDLLTIWRKLYGERDRMGPPSGT